MSGFTIDDVRQSFQTDLQRRLGEIDAEAAALLGAPWVAPGALFAADGRSPFDGMGAAGHAIAGTASLVAAESLASSARALEELALRGRDALEQAEQRLTQARTASLRCREGAQLMRQMLALELEGRRAE